MSAIISCGMDYFHQDTNVCWLFTLHTSTFCQLRYVY